jgi:hypothetical protein
MVYFCNIHMIQLQHTFETFKTIETYNCNIGGREREPDAGSAMAAGSTGIGGSRCRSRATRWGRARPRTGVEARCG